MPIDLRTRVTWCGGKRWRKAKKLGCRATADMCLNPSCTLKSAGTGNLSIRSCIYQSAYENRQIAPRSCYILSPPPRGAFRFGGYRLARCPRDRIDEHCPARSLVRSEEHTSELQSLMRISYAVFCLK